MFRSHSPVRRSVLPGLCLSLVVTLAACGDGEDGAIAGSGGGGPVPIDWQPCPLELGSAQDDAECATVQLPVRWDEPEGDHLSYFVQRFLGAEQPASMQLWLLSGGPGAAGNLWARDVRPLAELAPDVDFYIPDHRGTGRSSRLGCPEQEAPESPDGAYINEEEMPACLAAVEAQWGEGLQGFSSAGAARDVAALIERTRVPGTKVGLFGVSYGTTWGHRFLQLFPNTADAVVLDSTNWPDRTYEDYDQLWNDVAEDLFDACGSDAFCATKLGADPWSSLATLGDDLGADHCSELTLMGLSREMLRAVLAWMIAYRELRAGALAIVYRLIRCDADDRTAVVHAINTLFGPGGMLSFDDPMFSTMLGEHIMKSEVFREPLSSQAQAYADSCLVCLGAGARPFDADWPRYDHPAELQTWADTDTPVLILSGVLDPFAPYSRLDQAGAPAHFSGPGQHVLAMPYAPHGSVFSTPTTDPGALPCGLTMMLEFLHEAQSELDTSCISELAPVDFEGEELAGPLFDAADTWE